MSIVKVSSTEVLWQDVDDELILLDNRTSNYLRVAGSGVVLWPLIVDGASRADLAARLVELYDVDFAQASADVDVFVKGLLTNDLVFEEPS